VNGASSPRLLILRASRLRARRASSSCRCDAVVVRSSLPSPIVCPAVDGTNRASSSRCVQYQAIGLGALVKRLLSQVSQMLEVRD
jgi:hypothetical protein